MNKIENINGIPSLIIEEFHIEELSPSNYLFDLIHIKKDGKLVISESSNQWCILECKKIILEGSIVFRRFSRNLGNIYGKSSSGKILEYKFPESSIGGSGSDGMPIISLGNVATGGKGFKKNNSANGGGGGSGAVYTSENGPKHFNGNDAENHIGGLSPTGKINNGGNGGMTNNSINGGLLFIQTNDFSTNKLAYIDLSGEDGCNGKNGGDGFSYSGRYVVSGSPGGNGGGSAGGDGGVLIVHFENINEYPKVNVLGGKKGLGSKANSNSRVLPGEDGQRGINGFVKWEKTKME